MWTQIDQENGASEKFYMVLIAMQFGTICGKKIPDQVFSATVSPEGGFKLCKYSPPGKPGMNNRCASAPGIDGEGRWSHQIQMNPNFGQRAKISQQLSCSLLNWFKP